VSDERGDKGRPSRFFLLCVRVPIFWQSSFSHLPSTLTTHNPPTHSLTLSLPLHLLPIHRQKPLRPWSLRDGDKNKPTLKPVFLPYWVFDYSISVKYRGKVGFNAVGGAVQVESS
jgi:hypothetical protein